MKATDLHIFERVCITRGRFYLMTYRNYKCHLANFDIKFGSICMTSFKGLFAFLDMLLKNEKMYHYLNKLDWNIQSVEMMETLLANDIKLIEIIEILVYHKKITLLQKTLTNHDISSKIVCNNKLSNIVKHALKNNDLAILDLLISKGMCRSREDLVTQTGIAFAEKNDLQSLKSMQISGLGIQTKTSEIFNHAIYNDNIEMIQFLLQFPYSAPDFSVITYTPVEYAVLKNKPKILELLLTQNPDITTLHNHKTLGEINALIMAENNGHQDILRLLKSKINPN